MNFEGELIMKLVAIKHERSGKNTHFVTEDFKHYSLSEILNQHELIPLANVRIIEPKSGNSYLRSKPNNDSWGYIATPLKQVDGKTFERGHFYIHGGEKVGTEGWIELNGELNKNFHSFMRLYHRNFKLNVRYPKNK